MVVETSERCKRLEREGCSEKEDNPRRLEHNRQKDSQVTLSRPIRTALDAALSSSCQDNIVAEGRTSRGASSFGCPPQSTWVGVDPRGRTRGKAGRQRAGP